MSLTYKLTTKNTMQFHKDHKENNCVLRAAFVPFVVN